MVYPVRKQVVSAWIVSIAGCAFFVSSSVASSYAQVNSAFYNQLRPSYLVPVNSIHVLPKFGTRGSGVEYRYELSDRLKLRFEYSDISYNFAKTKKSVAYNINFKLRTKSAVLDWHPFGGSFRTSAGIIINSQDIRGSAFYNETVTLDSFTITDTDVNNFLNSAEVQEFLNNVEVQEFLIANNINTEVSLDTQSYTFDGASLSPKDLATVTGRISFREYSPYLGIGWGNKPTRKTRLFYSVDMGVMYIGRPRLELALTGPLANEIYKYYPSELEAYLAEEQSKLESEISKYRYYPVISAGFWYRF